MLVVPLAPNFSYVFTLTYTASQSINGAIAASYFNLLNIRTNSAGVVDFVSAKQLTQTYLSTSDVINWDATASLNTPNLIITSTSGDTAFVGYWTSAAVPITN